MKKIYLVQTLNRKMFKEEAKKGFKLEEISSRNSTGIIFANVHKKDAIKDCRKWNKEKYNRIYFYSEIHVY